MALGIVYLCDMSVYKLTAQIISVVFHPLSVLTYSLVFLLCANPYAFGVNQASDKIDLILIVFSTTLLIPGIAVVMMRFLLLVDDMQLRDRMQRVGPYIAAGIFYAWMTRNLMTNPDIPPVFAAICLGCTLAIFICFVINVQFKISLHTVGSAGMTAIFLILYLHYPYAKVNFALPVWGTLQVSLMTMVFLSVLIAGLVGTARLALGIHKPKEVYLGYPIGFVIPFLGLHVAEIIA